MSDTPASPGQPRPGLSRRGFLAGSAVGVGVGVGGAIAGYTAVEANKPAPKKIYTQSSIGAVAENTGIPGPFPGKVVEIHDPRALKAETKVLNQTPAGKDQLYTLRDPAVIREMLSRGMCELVGTKDEAEAWKKFISPGERVGIKIVPVGQPDSISSHELVLEIIAALQKHVGTRPEDVLVFDRYLDALQQTKYPDILPEGVRWGACSAEYDEAQLELDGQLPEKLLQDQNKQRQENVYGYDAEVYREMAFSYLGEHEATDDRRFRSHLTKIVTQEIDKLICIPVLKDHRSSGVTLALKNLSHGLVNNVARSHITLSPNHPAGLGGTLNNCASFIPAMVSLPPTRQKAVLQILDGLVATYEGGPGNWNKTFATWKYNSLFFATDPVAMDHIGWEIIDKKRAEEGWPAVGSMGLNASTGIREFDGKPYPESFHIRQPEHIAIAATLGLGVFDREKITHQRIDLA